MASIPAPSRRSDGSSSYLRLLSCCPSLRAGKSPGTKLATISLGLAFVAIALFIPIALRAQSASPHISSITPGTGKAADSITITGENLGKDKVAAVFLSDAKLDHKAVVVDQETTKIVIKVPDKLQPGDYNISVQEGAAIYIQPVIFVVKT